MNDLLDALQRFISGTGDLPHVPGPPGELLSEKEMLIVQLLLLKPGRYGLDLVKASKGELKRGTVYVTLNRMEDKGLVKSERQDAESEEDLPRPKYRVTALGERTYRAQLVANSALAFAMANGETR